MHTRPAHTLTDTPRRDAAREPHPQHGVAEHPGVGATTRQLRVHAGCQQHGKIEEESQPAGAQPGADVVFHVATLVLIVACLAETAAAAAAAAAAPFGPLRELIFPVVVIVVVVVGRKLLLHGFCPPKQKASH